MPLKRIKKKCPLDKFYTKPDVAKTCVDFMLSFLDSVDSYIEPSAGNGAFSLLIDCLALDIVPENDSIIQQDFLSFNTDRKNICFFGNPPFGERNSLTKAFIKKALSFSETRFIAFVLPAAYKKRTMQSVFPKNWSMIGEMKLPFNSFMLDGEQYHVPCIFQVWEKDSNRKNLREMPQPTECADFSFGTMSDSDIFVFGAAPKKIILPCNVSSTNRGYFLKTKIEIKELCDRIQSVDWKSLGASSVSGGVAWFSRDEFMKHYLTKWSKL
jgi:hypothetical protein